MQKKEFKISTICYPSPNVAYVSSFPVTDLVQKAAVTEFRGQGMGFKVRRFRTRYRVSNIPQRFTNTKYHIGRTGLAGVVAWFGLVHADIAKQ